MTFSPKQRLGWTLFAVPLLFVFLEPSDFLGTGGGIILLHFLHLAFAGGLTVFLFLIGRAALAGFGLLLADGWERAILATWTGFLLTVAGLFLLGMAGGLQAAVVWLLALLGAIVAVRTRGSLPVSLPAQKEFTKNRHPGWATPILGIVLGLLFLGSLIEALYPSPYSSDALAYHLAYPRLFADSKGYLFTPDSPLFFAYSGYWELLMTAVALFVRSEISLLVLQQILHLALGLGATALAILCLVRRLSPGAAPTRTTVALLGAALFVGMRPDIHFMGRFPLLAVAPKTDLALAALQSAGALALLMAISVREPSRRRAAILSGLFLGAAGGIKLIGGIAAVGLALGFWIIPGIGLSPGERLRLTGWTAVSLIAALSPMLVKNFVFLGNPVYPLFASALGGPVSPVHVEMQSGFSGQSMSLEGILRVLRLLIPSAPFLLIFGIFSGTSTKRTVYALVAAMVVSVLLILLLFTDSFPTRYALFIPAFSAACAACGLGEVVARRQKSWVMAVVWAMVVILVILPTHLDNRLKRAFRTASRTSSLLTLFLEMSPISRFQSEWPGRLPEGARPLTFYHSERLFALTRGWRPVVIVESPRLSPLFHRPFSVEDLEWRLAAMGFSHIYFKSDQPFPKELPIQPASLVEHLRGRPPLWGAHGFEIYEIGKDH